MKPYCCHYEPEKTLIIHERDKIRRKENGTIHKFIKGIVAIFHRGKAGHLLSWKLLLCEEIKQIENGANYTVAGDFLLYIVTS